MQTILDIIKVVAVFAVIFGPAVGKIYNSMKKRAAEREQEARRRRIRDEAIRTGRLQPGQSGFDTKAGSPFSTPQSPQPSPEADAKRRLQEMAQRRRAEVQAQQRSSSRPASPPVASSRPSAPLPGAPAADRRTIAQQRKAAHQEQQRRKAAAQLTQRQQQEAQRRQQQQQQEKRRAAAAAASAERDAYEVAPGHHMHSRADEGESVVHRLTTDAPADVRTGAEVPADALRTLLLGPMARLRAGESAAGVGVDAEATRAAFGDLRRAILLREILDRPVSMREPREIEGRMSV
ncbi:MAG TPA: hypothetical protein PL072_02890 [Phycisphaerales bacterium]|nr:hypothetical protein [Phycisphaerales bacterium]